MYRKRLIRLAWMGMACLFLLPSCGSEEEDKPNYERTLLMYYPWTGDSNALTSYFWGNISTMKEAYEAHGSKAERIVVFIATSGSKAYLFNISDYQGNSASALQTYEEVTSPDFTTSTGLLKTLNAMRTKAPAPRYSLIIGCHGQGWIPTSANMSTSRTSATSGPRPHWTFTEGDGLPLTRLFGGTSAKYQTDVSTLAEAIERMGTKMEYILFDDCYMASVEVAYDLREATDYIIACPTEVMGDGILAANVGRHLLGKPDYASVCDAFKTHYAASSYPYGTISAIKTDELDSLARVMKKVNALYTFDATLTDSLQRMDGYLPTLFFDMGDYLAHLCTDPRLLNEAGAQLARAVPYKAHTGSFPTVFSQAGTTQEYERVASGLYAIPIHTYSGLTIGEPTKDGNLAPLYPGQAWCEATH